MTPLFTSSGFVKSDRLTTISGNNVDVQAWPAFLRVLLTTDGTVTKSLEAYFWEEVGVEPLAQSVQPLAMDQPNIDSRKGDMVLRRHVQLKGLVSQRIYAQAESLILTQWLPDDLRASLEAGELGIGEILRESGLETYREILDLGESQQAFDGEEIPQVWRLYRILMNGAPVMQITESFPLSLYR